jgi:hypothetical protein
MGLVDRCLVDAEENRQKVICLDRDEISRKQE